MEKLEFTTVFVLNRAHSL